MKRTDLICENGVIDSEEFSSYVHTKQAFGTRYTDIVTDDEAAERTGLRPGRYVTVYSGNGDVKSCIAGLLREMIPEGSVLVAGLGNERICSDSLGTMALRYIPATAHLAQLKDFTDLGMRKVFVAEAGVTGKTGFESSSRIASEVRLAGAEAVIAIDSLACSGLERLCTVVQITDTGISPGSGVGNDRKALDHSTAGVPVIAVGVPTVIDLDCITGSDTGKGIMVTPRSIDASVHRFARIIGGAVSRALNPSLTEDELEALLIL